MAVPQAVLAAGWIPFVIVLVLSVLFATSYILWFRSTTERSNFVTVVAITALSVTMITSTLVPVDVFLVSFMKFPNGTYKSWAEDSTVREDLERTVLNAYYTLYGIILSFAFFFLPLVFFFQVGAGGEEGEAPESFSTKMFRALKFTALSVLIFTVIVLIGVFVPFQHVEPPPNATEWQKIETIFQEFRREKGENVIVFIMNVLNVIGMTLLVFYTGFGLSSLPVNMIKGQRSVHSDRANVQAEMRDIQDQIKALQEQHAGRAMNNFDVAQLERLEQQLRLLSRTDRNLEQNARSFLNRILFCCRPFQMIFGIIFALFGVAIFISLLLISIDKAMHSLGPKHGYILQNGTLPNPVDMVLVFTQNVFPLDYILYSGMIIYFIFCTMSGIKNIGIRFFWLSVYKIRSGNTKPNALLLMCITIIFILLAMNVLMFSVVPDYTTYGSQNFVANVTLGNVTTQVIEKCNDIEAPQNDCNMSRIAYLLLAFHSQAWIFGAIYYWMIWILLIVIFVGTGISVYRAKRYDILEEEEEDEEELLDDSNPFNSNPN